MWGYGGNYGGMMNWGGAGFFGIMWFLVCIVVFVDLILFGMWLWKQIKKK